MDIDYKNIINAIIKAAGAVLFILWFAYFISYYEVMIFNIEYDVYTWEYWKDVYRDLFFIFLGLFLWFKSGFITNTFISGVTVSKNSRLEKMVVSLIGLVLVVIAVSYLGQIFLNYIFTSMSPGLYELSDLKINLIRQIVILTFGVLCLAQRKMLSAFFKKFRTFGLD